MATLYFLTLDFSPQSRQIVLFYFPLFSFTLLHTHPLNPALNKGLPHRTGSALIIVCKLLMDTSGFLPTASSPLMWGVLIREPLRCRCYSCYCLMCPLIFDSVSGLWRTKVVINFLSSCIHIKTQLTLTFSGRWEFLCVIHVPNVPKWTPGKLNTTTLRMLD